jgi:HlyD family secretion protein
MARRTRFTLGAFGALAVVLLAGLMLWIAPGRQVSSAAQDSRQNGPLISRGFTDAPAGTVIIAGDPSLGGAVLSELKVAEGQKVQKGEIIAILSNYGRSETRVRNTEAELAKTEALRQAMLTGYRVTEIGVQEGAVRSTEMNVKLKALEIARSSKTPDMRQLELEIGQQELQQQQSKLRQLIDVLDTDRKVIEFEIAILKAKLETEKDMREQSLVRSPVNGVVVNLLTREGERVGPAGIAKIVDFSQLRVFADLDEVHLGRVVQGGRVDVTFRGSPTVYKGKIARVAPTVKRMQRVEPDAATSTDARVVQVEIELDDTAGMPQVLGRETRVTFL